jgi:hypothetical protein
MFVRSAFVRSIILSNHKSLHNISITFLNLFLKLWYQILTNGRMNSSKLNKQSKHKENKGWISNNT